jgi:hypothetical protein
MTRVFLCAQLSDVALAAALVVGISLIFGAVPEVQLGWAASVVEVPGNHEAVAAVVAGANEHQRTPATPEPTEGHLGDPPASLLHQPGPGGPSVYGALLKGTHL